MSQNKSKIAITIDSKLLERVDHVAEERGQSRSSVIERLVRNEIKSEEKFVKEMESPIHRAILGVMINTPGVVEVMAKLVQDNMSPTDAEEIKQGLQKQAARGKERSKKKAKSKPKT